ncbi:MAG: methylglutamate dehydrogenase [Proteobacteria bacterium]|nr:methylglutamate dehydrogenase [Pseudomonadota bacterium]
MPARGIEIADRSFRARFGVKGPQAESWLGELGFVVPSGANQWAASGDVLVARLATSEFLVESLAENDALVAAAVERLEAESRPLSVYPVGRQDLVLCLRGPAINELLRQTCGVDFAPHLLEPASSSGPLVLTSMIGVGVVAVPRQEAGSVELTLWLDPSFAHYFWTTLTGLISDLAGGESPE